MKLVRKMLIFIAFIALIYIFREPLLELKDPAVKFIADKVTTFMNETPELAPVTNVEDNLTEILKDADVGITDQ